MFKYISILLLLIVASEGAEKSYYFQKIYSWSDLGEIPKNSFVYPMKKILESLYNGKPEDSIKYFSEDAIYQPDLTSDNFYYILTEIKSRSKGLFENIRVSFHEVKSELKIILRIKKNNIYITQAIFNLKQIDGKWIIVRMG